MPVYQPDFSFLQSMQMRADMQYEQGLSQVKNVYGSIFNKSVTGQAMTQRQQEYARQAQDQMKDISAADLSDPKNVATAENIMQPFYKDPLLLKNISYTSWYQDQFQKQQAMKNSTDKDQRALYNPLVDSYLNNGVEQLANAPLTNDAYNKIEKRESIPVYDVDGDVRKEWTDLFGKDAGIKTTTADGAAMTIQTNGPKSLDAYKSFYMSVAGRDKYAAQNRIIATAKMENDMKDIQMKHPEMNPDELKQEYGREVVQGTMKYYNDAISSYGKTANEWRAKNGVLIPMGKDGKPLDPNKMYPPDVIAQVKYNNQMADQFQRLADQTTSDFTKKLGYNANTGTVDVNSDSYKKAVGDIAANPRDYISQVYMNHAADRWATGIAGISSVEIKENPVWAGLNKAENDRWDRELKLNIAQSNADLKGDALTLKTIEVYRKSGIPIPQSLLDEAGIEGFDNKGVAIPSTGTGTGSKKGPVVPSFGSGSVAITGTDVTKLPNLVNAFRQQQQGTINSINSTALSSTGFLSILSEVPNGMNKADVAMLSNDLQNALVTGKYNQDPATVARLQQFSKILKDNGVGVYNWDSPNIGPNQYRQGLMELTHKQSMAIFQTADADKQGYAVQLNQQYHEMEDQLANYNKRETEYKTAVDNFINTDKDGTYKKLINPDTHTFYTAQERAKDFPTLQVVVPSTFGISTMLKPNDERIITLTPEQLADYYAQNKLEAVKPGSWGWGNKDIVVDGKKYDIVATNGIKDPGAWTPDQNTPWYDQQATNEKKSNPAHMAFLEQMRNVEDKYGKPEDIDKLQKRASEKVMGNLSTYKNGVSAASISYDLSDKENPVQRATGEEILREALVPTNEGTYPMYTTGGDGKMDEKLDNKLQSVMHNAKYRDGFEGLVSGVRLTQFGPNGVPAAELTLSPDKSGKDENKDITSLREKKVIWIDLSPDAKGTILDQLPKAQTTFKYGQLLDGKEPIVSSATEESMGFKYSIVPGLKGPNGRSASATVVTQHWQINPDGTIKMDNNGKPMWTDEVSTPFNLMEGDHALSPDELIQKKNDWQMSILRKRQTLLKISATATPPDNQHGWMSAGDLFK